MSAARSRRRKRHSPPVRVPGWYYALLGGIAVVGAVLIGISFRPPTVDTTGLTTAVDYLKGQPDAPVTIVEWGAFQ